MEEEKSSPPLTGLDMMKLLHEAGGAQLATVAHPDKTGTGRKGQLWRAPQGHEEGATREADAGGASIVEEGYSYRQLGAQLKVPWGTARDWIKSKIRTPTKSRLRASGTSKYNGFVDCEQ
jgi:hypothetical protein